MESWNEILSGALLEILPAAVLKFDRMCAVAVPLRNI